MLSPTYREGMFAFGVIIIGFTLLAVLVGCWMLVVDVLSKRGYPIWVRALWWFGVPLLIGVTLVLVGTPVDPF